MRLLTMSSDELTPEALRALAATDPVKALKLARKALREKRAREQVERIAQALDAPPIQGVASAEMDQERRARGRARSREHYWRNREAELARRMEQGEPLDMRRKREATPTHLAKLAKRRALYAMQSGHTAPQEGEGSPDMEAIELALLRVSQGSEKPLDPEASEPHIQIDDAEPLAPLSLPSWIDPGEGGSKGT